MDSDAQLGTSAMTQMELPVGPAALGGKDKNDSKVWCFFLIAAFISCTVQFIWLGPKCFRRIDFDGMAYTGIAHEVRDGRFFASINAFRSPLVSWIIAMLSGPSTDYVRLGKFVTIATFFGCMALLYILALRLWHSQAVAALACLLFTTARGVILCSVTFVTPDFLFAAIVLLYFTELLKCVRGGSSNSWLLLGVMHGSAFLAKAFALPWLACCSLLAAWLSPGSSRKKSARVGLALVAPIAIAVAWGSVLHAKYQVFTTGTQFTVNLLQWTLRAHPQPSHEKYALLEDTSNQLDDYMVDDPMPPGSWQWHYSVSPRRALRRILVTEANNVPKALKELTIVATPGVLLAFFLCVVILARRSDSYPIECRFSLVVAVAVLSLIAAYSMLVFDGRYLYPVLPLVFIVGSRFLVSGGVLNHKACHAICIALVIAGAAVSLLYRSSPFRAQKRDFEVIGYRAGEILRSHPTAKRLVSIGSGPIPEHGVGWEAGYLAAYFAQATLIATMQKLPRPDQKSMLESDLATAAPDAIIIWGSPDDRVYANLEASIASRPPYREACKVDDPVLGEVGTLIF